MTPTFTCVLCGKKHPAVFSEPNPAPAEERAKLRAEMLKAEELLDKNQGVESYERKHTRTEMAYYSSLGGAGGWQFPETATTSKGANGFFIHCVECVSPPGT